MKRETSLCGATENINIELRIFDGDVKLTGWRAEQWPLISIRPRDTRDKSELDVAGN